MKTSMQMRDRPVQLPAHGVQGGFALVSVLIVVGVMAAMVAAYGTHVVLAGRGMASKPLAASREACQSGMVLARQGLLAGSLVPTPDDVDVDVLDLGDGKQRIDVRSLNADGTGARRVAEVDLRPSAALQPSGPSSLPSLSASTVTALLSDSSLPRVYVTSSRRYEDVDLTGLLILADGVELELSGVVLTGAVVSAGVLGSQMLWDYDVEEAPRLVIDGDVRIDSHPAFDGVAILMPDGAVLSAAGDARVQFHGDVVAHDLSLPLVGVLDGNVAGVNVSLADEATLDRLGVARKPSDWASALQLGGTQSPVKLAFVSPVTSLASLAPIISYWNQDGTP